MRYSPEQIPLNADAKTLSEYLTREFYKIANTIVTPDPYWEDARVSLTSTKAGGSKDPGFQKLKDNGAGSQGVFAYHFDKTVEEELYFEIQLPHSFYERHGVLKPHLHWCPVDTGTGVVRWGLEFTGANVGDVYGNTTIVYAEDAGDGTAYKHQIAAFADLDATSFGISRVIVCRLFRDATHANDTYNADAAALSFDYHIQMDAPGSELEYIKRIPRR